MRGLRRLLAAIAVLALAAPAFAQAGRVHGVVKSTDGTPIKGAAVVARNPNASPSEFTATTDDRGRWSMIGLRPGAWTFTAAAPGFDAQGGTATVRTIGPPNPPFEFILAPSAPAAAPGLSRDVQSQLKAAEDLRTHGQFDQAIAAYQSIQAANPSLTMINMVIGSTYRQKAARETAAAEQQAALRQAVAAFREMLNTDPRHERARLELGLAYMQAGDIEAAAQALEPLADSGSASADVYYNVGELRFSRGDVDGAEVMFKRASELGPTWQQPRLKLGLIAFNRGDHPAAIKVFEDIVAAAPGSPEADRAREYLEDLRKVPRR